VPAPRTGLWRGQHAVTMALYAVAGLSILATFALNLFGDPHAATQAGADVLRRSPWLEWVGRHWSWVRLLPLGLAGGILVALHRPRRAVLRLDGTLLTLASGRRTKAIDVGRAALTWERWPGHPESAPRPILRLDAGSTTWRVGLPDQPGQPHWPHAPDRHAAPDVVLDAATFGALRRALRERGVVWPATGPAPPAPTAANARAARAPRGPLGRLWARVPRELRLLCGFVAAATALGLPLVEAVRAGWLGEAALPVFSLVILVTWAGLAWRWRRR
jgi:hypothetical protein